MRGLRAEPWVADTGRLDRAKVPLTHPTPLRQISCRLGVRAEPGFRDDLYRARDVRGDYTFGEQILDIADDGTNDWVTAKNGAQVVNKELVLRSKLRIEARQFHMSRLHVQTWGEKQTIDIKNDWALLSEEERGRKADELIQMIRELREPPMQPPPLVYRPEEAPDEREPSGIGSQRRPVTRREG
jgi:hypothetical protein